MYIVTIKINFNYCICMYTCRFTGRYVHTHPGGRRDRWWWVKPTWCAAWPGPKSRRAQGLCWCWVWGKQAPVSSNPFYKLKPCLLPFSTYALLCAFKFQELFWNLVAWSLGLLCSFASMLGTLVPCSKDTVEVE
jgi:hypothetical protein